MRDDEVTRVREALSCLYGAVAAILRHDSIGTELLLTDLCTAFDEIADVLVSISVATLERLEAAVAAGPVISSEQGRPIAHDLLTIAQGYGGAEPACVQGAAWRLDAVRRGDRQRAIRDVHEARREHADTALVLGATSLLAATVVLWARRTGQSAGHAASDLCLAASLDPAA